MEIFLNWGNLEGNLIESGCSETVHRYTRMDAACGEGKRAHSPPEPYNPKINKGLTDFID